MEDEEKEIAQSEKITNQYNELVAICEKRFKPINADHIGLDKSKVSRVYNKQFDLLTLSEIASLLGYEVDIVFNKRTR